MNRVFKNKYILLSGITVALSFLSCDKNADCNGSTIKHIETSAFSGITLISDFDVQIAQSDSTYITLQGCTSDLERIDFENNNGHVTIKRGNKKSSAEPIIIIIGIPELSAVITEGTVDVDIAGFTTEINRSFKTGGTGTMSFNGIAATIHLDLSGTTKLNLSGSAPKMEARLSGVTHLKAYNFVTNHCTVNISGTSQCEVYVTDLLDGTASQATTVRYKGTAINNISVSEAARVVKE